jgi:hypothetical protein
MAKAADKGAAKGSAGGKAGGAQKKKVTTKVLLLQCRNGPREKSKKNPTTPSSSTR